MVTMAQRIEALRTEKGLSRPALSAALGLPRTAAEKFETGRQTPNQAQQEMLASLFGVSLFYLRGESDDRTDMNSWLNGSYTQEEIPVAPAVKQVLSSAPTVVASAGEADESPMLKALLKSKDFQAMVRTTVLEVLRSPEGKALLAKAVRK